MEEIRIGANLKKKLAPVIIMMVILLGGCGGFSNPVKPAQRNVESITLKGFDFTKTALVTAEEIESFYGIYHPETSVVRVEFGESAEQFRYSLHPYEIWIKEKSSAWSDSTNTVIVYLSSEGHLYSVKSTTAFYTDYHSGYFDFSTFVEEYDELFELA